MTSAIDSRQSRTSNVKEVAFELTPAGKDIDGKEPEKHSVKYRAQSNLSGRADV